MPGSSAPLLPPFSRAFGCMVPASVSVRHWMPLVLLDRNRHAPLAGRKTLTGQTQSPADRHTYARRTCLL